ncbi:M48 family metallopeptidase [Helcobacillus massiliensis]|uniref:M48 metallopeptidase family protein n=1 Tax=Helcobacillus massiliensis TaxID=521392 RepID=UPI0021A661C1|nr:M48 family metallopeptidase [Helcobacillus massiliensis]MCT1558452.1 M48 family metallopeptidase [Helcobacillus massiliensis]MCT2037499.1 M48 family metallopeptidase [Helcobacillus massiliensis]MCT2332095.1 M48 family metallopeptidase [Helcobacillus massiliensis]
MPRSRRVLSRDLVRSSATRRTELVQFADIDEPILVTRSKRRRRTISARRVDGRMELQVPWRLSAAEEHRWALHMLERAEQSRHRAAPSSDDDLLARARELTRRYLPPGTDGPVSVRWVRNQGSRWGSCSTLERTIRLSDQLQGMPRFVQDAVLVHELAHLVEANHSPAFWAIADSFEHAEKAKGFLEGVAYAQSLPPSDF